MTTTASQTFKVSDLTGPSCGECGSTGSLNLPFDKNLGTVTYESHRPGQDATVTFVPDPA